MWIMNVPVLSTHHLTPETANTEVKDFTGPGELFTVLFDEGFMVFVEHAPDVPDDLMVVGKWARENGYSWVRFSGVGGTVKDLPVYEW